MQFVSQIDPDLFVGPEGRRFLQAADKLEDRNIPLVLGTPFDVNGEVLPPYPLSALPHAISIIHRDGNVFSNDNVTRRALLSIYQKHTFHPLLAGRAGLLPSEFIPPGLYHNESVDTSYSLFRFHDRDPGYTRVSFWDLMNGAVDANLLKGKILLVGSILRENPADFTKTPLTSGESTGEGEPKLVVHADIIDSLLNSQTLRIAPRWITAGLTFAVSALVLWWVLVLTPAFGVLSTGGVLLGTLVLQAVAYRGIGALYALWLPIAPTVLAILISYYLGVPFRLVREYRKRWNFQRQNEVLVQVEKLKTNFLNLVTHDLKTPVARVQGLAEVVLQQAGEALKPRDQANLREIQNSAEELNRFISSILELSKAESSQLKLNLESKDINQLIERSIEQFVPQAHAKSIRFLTELEPLFPIRIDATLICKVLNNILDNAIKYSPEESMITVDSREVGDHVEIRIRDQGIGMSEEERDNVFTRFYRAQNQATSRVHGSGLGLYLSKFFIEAHHGTISVESRPGEGSTFVILLPIEQPAAAPIGLRTEFTKEEKPHASHSRR
jgi:signal transduction histidine kinase